MTSETGHQLIDDYLDRLERAAQVLPAERRIELLADIREHIENARASDGIDGEADLRALLERMGAPEEIVTAEADAAGMIQDRPKPDQSNRYQKDQPIQDQPWPPVTGGPSAASAAPSGDRPRRSLALEIWAVLMLTIGSIVLPIVGWLVGVGLLWFSDRWRLREKVLATLVVPGGIGGLLGVLVLGAGAGLQTCVTSYDGSGAITQNTCDDHPVADVLRPLLSILLTVAVLLVPFVLLHLARRRAHAESAVPMVSRTEQPIA